MNKIKCTGLDVHLAAISIPLLNATLTLLKKTARFNVEQLKPQAA